MKNFFFLIFLGIIQLSIAQHRKITQLLNHQLQKDSTEFYSEDHRANFTVTKPFSIDENNTLRFAYAIKSYDGGKISINSQIPLHKIVNIGWDYTIYFESSDNDVTETRTDYDKNGNVLRTRTTQTHLFSTEIIREQFPNRLMKWLVKSFKKAGYNVECNFLKL